MKPSLSKPPQSASWAQRVWQSTSDVTATPPPRCLLVAHNVVKATKLRPLCVPAISRELDSLRWAYMVYHFCTDDGRQRGGWLGSER